MVADTMTEEEREKLVEAVVRVDDEDTAVGMNGNDNGLRFGGVGRDRKGVRSRAYHQIIFWYFLLC